MNRLRGINSIREAMKDEGATETLKVAGIITRIFLEDLKYAVIKALDNPEIDIVKEMDTIESLYRFNDTMNKVMDGQGNAKGQRELAMKYYKKREYPSISYSYCFWCFDVFYDGVLCEDFDKQQKARMFHWNLDSLHG